MVNIVHRSRLVGFDAIDRETATRGNAVQEVWIDSSGRVSRFTTDVQAYTPTRLSRQPTTLTSDKLTIRSQELQDAT